MTMKQLVAGMMVVLLGGGVWWISRSHSLSVNQLSSALPRVSSYYKNDIPWIAASPRPIPELQFLLETLQLTKQRGSLPTSLQQYDQKKLTTWVELTNVGNEKRKIPEAMRQLYLSDEALMEITTLLQQTRQEYIALIKTKGVAQRYINAIETTVLPNDTSRLAYIPHDGAIQSKGTNTHIYDQAPKGDYSALQIDVYAWNIYQQARLWQYSGVLGVAEDNAYRDMALRHVVYHEMTHVLQQTVDMVNAPLMYQKTLMPWIHSSRSVLMIDAQYYPVWGVETDQLTRDVNNITVARESQAEGIATQLLNEVYQLSPAQQRLVWEHHFGGLNEGAMLLSDIFTLAQETNPNVSVDYMIHQIRRSLFDPQQKVIGEPRQTIFELLDRLEGLMAAYVGYLHPMKLEETHLFWDYLKE